MNAQPGAAFHGNVRSLDGGRVLPLGSAGGRLEVLHGRVWLTRAGDPDDYFVDLGQSVVIPASGRALVEAIDDGQPALIAWRPRTVMERIGAILGSTFRRCWDIVDPVPRIGAGALAAAIALVSGVLLFGPLSDQRTLSMAGSAVLHNSGAANARLGAAVPAIPRGPRADAGAAEPRDRDRSAAQQAGCRTAGVA
ncbi:MAG TPA: DUF2917 domain-containing protein [Caldimonas sp.]